MKKRRARTDCAVLQYRDERWAWAEPICTYIDDHREDAFEAEELGVLSRLVPRNLDANRSRSTMRYIACWPTPRARTQSCPRTAVAAERASHDNPEMSVGWAA